MDDPGDKQRKVKTNFQITGTQQRRPKNGRKRSDNLYKRENDEDGNAAVLNQHIMIEQIQKEPRE